MRVLLLHQVDKAALLADYRKRRSRKFEGSPAATLGDQFDTDSPAMFAKAETKNSPDSLAVRRSIARAINSVLPDSLPKTTEWIARSPSATTHESEAPTRSNLSFTDLGGTSLMAVEAAWLTSRFLVGENNSISSDPLLEGADFLSGTLDDIALVASNNVRKKSNPNAVRLEATSESSDVGARRADSRTWSASPQLPILSPRGSPISPSSTVCRVGEETSRGVKRRLEEQESRRLDSVKVRQSPQFVAVGRAGTGTLHCAECLAASAKFPITKHAAVVEHVAFRTRWSTCLTKCIDATPLVILPRTYSPHSWADAPSERTPKSVEVSTSRTCCGLVRPSKPTARGGAQLLIEGGTGHAIENAPNIPANGMVFIGSHSGKFSALSLDTGESQWALTVGGRIESGACCSSDGSLVYVGCHDRYLRAVCRRTGSVRWSHETGEVIKCTPVSVSADDQDLPSPTCDPGMADMRVTSPGVGAVLVGSHDGFLRCLRQVDGELLWSFDCGGALFASPAHDSKARVVYASTTKGRLLAIARSLASKDRDSITGDDLLHCAAEHKSGKCIAGPPFILWEQHLPSPCFSSPAVCASTGALVMGCVDGKMYCFSADGDRLWVCADGEKPIFSSPCLLPTLPGEGEGAGKGPDLVWGCHDG